MPPRKKGSAPAARVYKGQPPLQQAKFPSRRKAIKTYGTHSSRQLPKLQQQDTLTQMDFVKMRERELAEEEEEDEDEDPIENKEDSEVEVTTSKRKRRKTMGDAEEEPNEEERLEGSKKVDKKLKKKRRKTAGDKPSDNPRYHTQTITQLDWSFTSVPDDEEGVPEEPEQEDEVLEEEQLPQHEIEGEASFDSRIYDVPSSSQALPLPKNTVRRLNQDKVPASSPEPDKTTAGKMGPPQTPRRTLVRVIPSSESPATPLSIHSTTHEGRASLTNISINTPIPLNFNPNNPKRTIHDSSYELPRLEVKDTFDTSTDISQMSRFNSSPPRKSSPKTVRFAIPASKNIPAETESPPRRPATQATLSSSILEIMDSDAESDEDYLDDEPAAAEDGDSTGSRDQASHQPETCYGDLGEETQFEIDRILSTPILNSEIGNSQVEHDTVFPAAESGQLSGSPTLTPIMDGTNIEDEMEDVDVDVGGRETQFEEKTQFSESQRLHTQHYAGMAPRTINSDVFVSLPSQRVTELINRERDHDVRNWAFPPTVSRLWIYVTKPVGALKYMAEISPAKRPGEIEDEAGLGNKVFNSKKASSSWHAYEILELYELADPLPLAKLIDHEWLQEAPKKHMPVRPAVLDSLMANLMPPLFRESTQEEPVSTMNDTQEAGAQLLDTMKQFTQIAPSPIPASSPPLPQDTIPSSHEEEVLLPPSTKSASNNNNPPDNLSQATTVDNTQTQQQTQTLPQPQAHTPRKPPPAHDIIWESPTRPVLSNNPSSTPARLPTPRLGTGTGAANGCKRHHLNRSDSVTAPYSITSSQLLTETQMEREGVGYESLRPPPLFVQDSDEDDDDDDDDEGEDEL